MAHVLYNGVRSGHTYVLLTIAGSSGSAYVLIAIATSADDGRITAASGQLPRQTAGGGDAGHLAFLVQDGAIDGSCGWIEDLVNGVHALVLGNAKIGGDGVHLLDMQRLVFQKA